MRLGYLQKNLLILCLVVALVSLADGGKNAVAAESGSQSSLSIEVPQSGTMPARVRKLWGITKPIIEADSKANYPDAEYQARRLPLFTAWVNLQRQDSTDEISRLIPRILELIDHVYGFPGTPAAKRMETRKNLKRQAYLLKDIDRRVSKLP